MNSLLLICLIINSLNGLNKIEKDSRLSSVAASFNGMNLNSLTAYFGVSSKHSKIQTNFDLQINLPYVLVGNEDTVGWGIRCGTDKEDIVSTCIYDKVGRAGEPWP